jgi:hypothetical protein
VKIWQARTRRTVTPDATLQSYLSQPIHTSDHVLLCSFGPNLTAERTATQLRRALTAAGLPGSAVRYLLRTSPLIDRSPAGRYRLRPFQL